MAHSVSHSHGSVAYNEPTEEPNVWEFVHCGRCMLSFDAMPANQPPLPFWLTQCGHILCNTHLTADRICAQCGTSNIEVVALQRNISEPMASWFASIPLALENLAQTVRFQQALMASEARYYKTKSQEQVRLLERAAGVQQELRSLRLANESLQRETVHLRSQLAQDTELNSNGKRRRIDSAGTTPTMANLSIQTGNFDQTSSLGSSTSPQYRDRIATPGVPPRLSLPIQFIPPEQLSVPHPQRPLPTSLSQFAYVPPQTPNAQSRAGNGQQYNVGSPSGFGSPMTTASQRLMPPPPLPTRSQFRPVASSTPHPANRAPPQKPFNPPQPIPKTGSTFRPAKVLSSGGHPSMQPRPSSALPQQQGIRQQATGRMPQFHDNQHSGMQTPNRAPFARGGGTNATSNRQSLQGNRRVFGR